MIATRDDDDDDDDYDVTTRAVSHTHTQQASDLRKRNSSLTLQETKDNRTSIDVS